MPHDLDAMNGAQPAPPQAAPGPMPSPFPAPGQQPYRREFHDEFGVYYDADDGHEVVEPLAQRPIGRWATFSSALDLIDFGPQPEMVRRVIRWHTGVRIDTPGRVGWLPDGVAVQIQQEISQFGGRAALDATDQPPSPAAPPRPSPPAEADVVDRLQSLSGMLDAGRLTRDEFEMLKSRLLGSD